LLWEFEVVKKKVLLLILAVWLSVGCGGGHGVGVVDFINDPFYDDFGDELIAIDDQYSTLQNQVLSVGDSNGVLSNDFVCFCEDLRVRFPPTTASGGSVTGRNDGSFVYTPPTNFTGTDFFEYRLEDDFGSSVATVTIAVNEPPNVGFFVDNLNGSDATGSGVTGAPFATIQAALLAAGANGKVVVEAGNGSPYAGTVNMLDGQTLVGAGFELVAAQGTVRPALNGPIIMADNCVVRGITIRGGEVNGSTSRDGEISQCDFTGIADYAVDLDGSGGFWLLEDNLVENCGGGVSVELEASEELVLLLQFNTFRNNTQSGIRLLVSGSSDLSAGIFNNLLSDNQIGFAFDARATNSSTFCMDLSRNQNDDTYRLTRTNALFQVEQFTELTDLNTGTVTVPNQSILDVEDGFCGF
jgi:hypothetical protein